MLRIALLATLLVSTPVLFAKERILLHRIGPSQSTLFIANADGSDERPLLPNSGFDYNASFSADGKWVIFASERSGSADIYRVHPDGSGLEQLTNDPAYDDQGALSPDGKQLAFVLAQMLEVIMQHQGSFMTSFRRPDAGLIQVTPPTEQESLAASACMRDAYDGLGFVFDRVPSDAAA